MVKPKSQKKTSKTPESASEPTFINVKSFKNIDRTEVKRITRRNTLWNKGKKAGHVIEKCSKYNIYFLPTGKKTEAEINNFEELDTKCQSEDRDRLKVRGQGSLKVQFSI